MIYTVKYGKSNNVNNIKTNKYSELLHKFNSNLQLIYFNPVKVCGFVIYNLLV